MCVHVICSSKSYTDINCKIFNRYKWKAWTDLGRMDQGEAMRQNVMELKSLVSKIPETEASLAFLNIYRDKFQMEEGYETLDRSQECVEVSRRSCLNYCT